jgi:crotonobetainyl-CoA:carnitine CoA-transferase CaiB-like acyl-CoA transferase
VRLLAGVTVLSLEQATTLPFLTYRLACDGARVIRVENAERPDPNRFVGRDVLPEPAMRSYFLPNNCGKEAITLNLGHPEGQALLRG